MLIRTERRGHVLVISINREHKRNSIDRHTADQLDDALNTLDDDPDLWVGVLTGTRTMFSAGSDVNANRHYHTDRGGEYGLIRRRRAKPLIAAVEGFALGGGMEIALACDMVVASATSRFGLPEVKIGVLPGSAGLFRAPRSLPVNLARQLILTGDPISAQRAYEAGLVNVIAEPGASLERALELAEAVCANAPLSVQASLRAVNDLLGDADGRGWELTDQAWSAIEGTEDLAEGIGAFLGKRKPVWRGR